MISRRAQGLPAQVGQRASRHRAATLSMTKRAEGLNVGRNAIDHGVGWDWATMMVLGCPPGLQHVEEVLGQGEVFMGVDYRLSNLGVCKEQVRIKGAAQRFCLGWLLTEVL